MGRNRRPINLALQGGGAHGAFTWGVLDQLLADGRLDFDGICGTSAGAMNAVVCAHGYLEGRRDGARAALDEFWRRISALGAVLSPVRPLPEIPGLPGVEQIGATVSHFWLEAFIRVLSPYQFNPLNLNPLRELLAELVDFERLRRAKRPKLFIAATNVRSGKVKVFRNEDLAVDAVLASACLPYLFQAVEIDGEAYWDGGYMGNPVLYPLLLECDSRDIVIVHINPLRRDRVPRTALDIANRINEISFNASLLKELRTVAAAQSLARSNLLRGKFKRRFGRALIHSIRCDETSEQVSVASKLNPDLRLLEHLREHGQAAAREWLGRHFRDLGRRSSFDIEREFL
ncbi:MAG TPA: patatin-like phospholipase family protein [Candidatus Competibacteraceae bacterium]|nr:patatin-like phospholipase family protein [Candidatus Competibacteraceae bacterium]